MPLDFIGRTRTIRIRWVPCLRLTAAARQTHGQAFSEALTHPSQRIARPMRCFSFSVPSSRVFGVLHATLLHAAPDGPRARSKTRKLEGSKQAMYPDMRRRNP